MALGRGLLSLVQGGSMRLAIQRLSCEWLVMSAALDPHLKPTLVNSRQEASLCLSLVTIVKPW